MDVGGRINYQAKFNGKAAKSYLVPHSAIPENILREWIDCK